MVEIPEEMKPISLSLKIVAPKIKNPSSPKHRSKPEFGTAVGPVEVDIRLGMLAIVPSVILGPDEINMKMAQGFPKVQEALT